MPLSLWGAPSALVSKGDLRDDFPSLTIVKKGKNEGLLNKQGVIDPGFD